VSKAPPFGGKAVHNSRTTAMLKLVFFIVLPLYKNARIVERKRTNPMVIILSAYR
jgi:hypothetical protein